ncbi:MAG: AAA family ATPase, partial [Spirochaetaceae bacterium]|nr:AAA family ATPase [Spirochaetaceae bacterium]
MKLQNKPRVVLGAPRSGSGKTLVSIALMQALTAAGKKVSAYKCGPDYIDPMFHKKILGVPSRNLDLFFADEELVKSLFVDSAASSGNTDNTEISVIEGVMGLFDGIGTTDQASTYHLSKTLAAPIILIVDSKGMGRSVIAEIAGFLMLDKMH